MKASEADSWRDWTRWGMAGVALALLIAWEIAGRSSVRVNFLLSRPSQIWDALIAMVYSGALVSDIGVTAGEALLGTVPARYSVAPQAWRCGYRRRATRVATPIVAIVANFPVFALAPAAIIWLGIGISLKVFLAAFATFFVSLNLAYQGAQLAHDVR